MSKDNENISSIYEVLTEAANLQKAKVGAAVSHVKDIGSKISSAWSGDKHKLSSLNTGGSGKDVYNARVATNLINGFIKSIDEEIRKTNDFLVKNNYKRDEHPDVHAHLSSLYQIVSAAKHKLSKITPQQ